MFSFSGLYRYYCDSEYIPAIISKFLVIKEPMSWSDVIKEQPSNMQNRNTKVKR
jgi:hypothetical protein